MCEGDCDTGVGHYGHQDWSSWWWCQFGNFLVSFCMLFTCGSAFMRASVVRFHQRFHQSFHALCFRQLLLLALLACSLRAGRCKSSPFLGFFLRARQVQVSAFHALLSAPEARARGHLLEWEIYPWSRNAFTRRLLRQGEAPWGTATTFQPKTLDRISCQNHLSQITGWQFFLKILWPNWNGN